VLLSITLLSCPVQEKLFCRSSFHDFSFGLLLSFLRFNVTYLRNCLILQLTCFFPSLFGVVLLCCCRLCCVCPAAALFSPSGVLLAARSLQPLCCVGFVIFRLFFVASCCIVLLWCWPLLCFSGFLFPFVLSGLFLSLLPPLGIPYAFGVVSQ
jgi:hypothetical protein